MFRLGRVRFDLLEEDDDDILGVGTFGIVQSGTYMGEEVAIKKAQGPVVGDPAVLREFRWVFGFRSFRVYEHTPTAKQRGTSIIIFATRRYPFSRTRHVVVSYK